MEILGFYSKNDLNGYYLNHGQLLATKDEQLRARLRTYFVALNTPTKLEARDAHAVFALQAQNDRLRFTVMAGLSCIAAALLVRAGIKGSLGAGLLQGGAVTGLSLFSGNEIMKNMQDAAVVRSPLIQKLSDKYAFGTYDFAVSKRDAVISSINTMLIHTHSPFIGGSV